MTSLSLQELIAKWTEKLAQTRAELEAKAKAGDREAIRILAGVGAAPPVPSHHEREPGSDDE